MKAPIIFLIILLFAAIFLYGSILTPYVGDGLYYGRVQSTEGSQWLDTVIRYEPVEGGQQFFTMYNILYDGAEDDAPIMSMTKVKVQYSGNYFKHVFGPLFLRPTGLHFPVVDFEGRNKFVLNWQAMEITCLDAQGEPVESTVATAPHRSTITASETGMNFDRLPYEIVKEVPAKLLPVMEILDNAEVTVYNNVE